MLTCPASAKQPAPSPAGMPVLLWQRIARPPDKHARSLLDIPVSVAWMTGILRFRMGCHRLPRDEGSCTPTWARPLISRLERVCQLYAAVHWVIFSSVQGHNGSCSWIRQVQRRVCSRKQHRGSIMSRTICFSKFSQLTADPLLHRPAYRSLIELSGLTPFLPAHHL